MFTWDETDADHAVGGNCGRIYGIKNYGNLILTRDGGNGDYVINWTY